MKKYTILKLIGLAILTMAVLVAISFIEVAIYAYLVNPGHDQAFYDAHAQVSAPYISGIFGFIVFFLVSRYWKKKGYENAFRLAMLFPLIYVLIDVVILFAAGVNWADFILIFIIANTAKFLGSYLGYTLTK
ncbi:MAG: hypothetical protein ACXWDO_09805 [Bacteroidia bacterium]